MANAKNKQATLVSYGLNARRLLAHAFILLVLAALTTSHVAGAEADAITFEKTWGQRGDKPGEFAFPIAIAINQADEIFIIDHLNHRVQKFDTNGKFLKQYKVLPNPAAIALDADGKLYLTHFHASGASSEKSGNRASVYDASGKLLREWGQTGSGEGEFDCPGGIALGPQNRIYIADQTNHRVQVFDNSGKFLFQWGKHGNDTGQFGGKAKANSRVGGPQFLAFDNEGNVWTTEGANCRIQKFTADGKYLSSWGSDKDEAGSFGGLFAGFKNIKPGSLVGPIALCFDKHDHLWVSTVGGRVQQFSKEGKYLRGLVDEQGTEPGHFYAPHGLAFDSKGFLYVVDAYNHRIQKFKIPE